jgi:hypothetical protein
MKNIFPPMGSFVDDLHGLLSISSSISLVSGVREPLKENKLDRKK